MRPTFIKTLVFIVFLPVLVNATGKRYLSWHEEIEVSKDKFTTKTSVVGIGSKSESSLEHIPYHEFDDLKSFKFEISDGNGYKKVRGKDITDSDYFRSTFFENHRSKRCLIPPATPFRCEYEKVCSENMLLSHLEIASTRCTNYSYQISVPNSLELTWFIPEFADSTWVDHRVEQMDGFNIHYFETGSIPESDIENWGYISLPVMLHPTAIDPETYLVQWLNTRYGQLQEISQDTKRIIDEITAGAESDEEISARLFEYVQTNIRYVSIEQAYGAWIARDPNSVLNNKRGDCKDMSNFLCQALRYKGITADNALVASLHRRYGVYHPSLSFANHMICRAVIDGKVVFLDPTDSQVEYGLPSIHTQGRSTLVLAGDGFLDSVPIVSAEQNKRIFEIHMNINTKEGVNGYFDAQLFGLNSAQLQVLEKEMNSKDRYERLGHWFEPIFKPLSLDSLDSDETRIRGKVKTHKSFLSSSSEKKYLDLVVLPSSQLELPNRKDLPFSFYKTVQDSFLVHLKFSDEVSLDHPIKHEVSEGPFAFNFSIEQHTTHTLVAKYSIFIDTIQITKENYQSYENVVKEANKALTEFLVLH